MTLQGLEARQLLSASLQVFNGSTQYSSGSSDSFGTVTVGTPDTQNLTVKNVGDATLTISSDSFPNGFSSSTSLPLNVAAGQTATFTVSMNTNSMGNYSGPLTLGTNDPSNSNFVLNLSGMVQQSSGGGTITLYDGSTQLSNGGSDSFGTVLTGSNDTKSFTVTNAGSATLSVNSVSLPSGYSLNTSLPMYISPNQSSTLSVRMGTSSVGDYSGQMLVQSSDTSHNPFTVNLSGTVVRSTTPSITLQDGSTTIANGGSDSFGSVTQGNADSRTYTVTDWGSNTLTVSAPTLPTGYTTSTTFPLNVTAGNSATFVVSMNTSTVGTVSGQMTLPTNDPNNSTFGVNLSGTVTAPAAPVMALADGSTTIANGGSDGFGSVTQGTSDTRTYTVKNTGTASLTVSAVNPPTSFSLQTAMPLTIAAGGSTTFVVAMSTSTVGSLSGTMSITDTDSNNNPYTVSLSGTVTAPPLAPAMSLADGSTTIANGGSDSFGSATQGTSDTRTYTVKNTGTASLTVSAVNPPPGFSLQTAMPLTIAAGGSTTFVVAMSTATVGSVSGTMAITDTDSNNNPYNVSLSGTVTAPPAGVNIQASVPTASEPGNTPGQFTVTRSGSTSGPLTVNYTVSGTATPGVDYTALSGTVTINVNMTSATITVAPLTGGNVDEVQQIVLPSPTGGSYTLSIGSNTTSTLAYNASAAAVAAALAALPSVGVGRVAVAGSGTSASPFVVTFHGPLGGPAPAQIVAAGSQLTGGSSTGSGTGGITASVTTVGEDGGTVTATLSSSSSYNVGTPPYDTVTVIGEEPPVITVVATTPTADEVSGTAGAFTLYRNGPTINALTVNYTLGGSTLDGVDYTWVPGSVTFAAGQATAVITIAPINNGLPSPAKTAVLSLSAPQGGSQPAYALAGANSDTVTIADTNLPIVTILATTPTADEEVSTAGEFTVTRNGDLTNALTVNYTVGGTAVAGSQYQAVSGSVTIPAGQGYATVDITPLDDGGAGTSTSSTVVLSVTSSSSYQLGSGSSGEGSSDTVTISDDDLPQVSIAASTPLAVESTAAPGAFTISIASALATSLTVPYTVSGTAVSGTDFQPLSGSATIPAGQTSVAVQVVPLNDPAEVGFTTVQANLSSGSGYELTASKTAVVSIEGNMSVPKVTIAATTPVADEIAGTSGIFTVTRSGSTANALIAYYTIAGSAVDGTDYNLLPGSVTIPAGQATTTIIITPKSDPAMQDTSRTVTLNLTNYGGPSGASYSIGNPAGDTVTINDLPTVSIHATTATAQEHELTPGVFTVTRANDPLQASQALTVNYTIAGTAVNGTNYQTLSAAVTIPAGQSSATITVTPIDADVVSGSQTVLLTVASGGYLVGTASSDTVTINDDDLPTVGIQATTPTASEVAGTPGVFTVTRNGPTTSALTVPYSVSGTGVAGTNYQALSGTVTIPAGSATATINVTPINIGEVGGTFSVVATLSASSAYWLTAVGPTPAPQTSDTVTILENDLPVVMLQAMQTHATESGTTGTFTVSRNGVTTNPLIVLYTIAGTAANGTDYQTLPGNVTIPAGQSTATITVTPINDPAVEQDQSVTLTLAATSQYVAGSQYNGTVTIFDDNLPSVTVAATANADEEKATAGQFTVTRVGATDNPLTVNYTVSGTAQSGTDFQSVGTSVTIPAGQSSATIAVTPLDDNNASEVQQIVVPPATGGTYTLSINSDTTGALPYNASASAVQAALTLLPEVGTGNVAVTGLGTTASPFVVTFSGGLLDANVPQITGNASQLTGTTSVSVATTTAGRQGVDQVEQVGYQATGAVTGGTFTLSFNGSTTAALAYNASAATVQSALQALSSIGAGNVVVSALSTGPNTFTWQVTFQGTFNDETVSLITTNASAITVTSGSVSSDNSIITQGSMGGGINAVQQVTVTGAAGGTFTLTYQGATTAGIAYNATAATVQSALQALATIGTNNVSVSGNAGGPWTVTFVASLADQPIPNMTASGSGLTAPPVATSIVAQGDGNSTVVLTLATASTYAIGTLAAPTASGGTGASDTVTIADNDNIAPTAAATQWSTLIGQSLSVAASGVLSGAQDPNSNATLTAVLLTGVANGTLTLNSNGSFTYTPNAGFTGTDGFYFQAYDGSLYSAPEQVTISVTAVPAPQIGITDGPATVANGGSVAFGQTYVGTAVTQTFTISNPGTATLNLSSWTAPSGFTITTTPAATVAAGGSTTMVVQMNATTAGSPSGTFSLSDNVTGASPYTFTVSGTVVSPASALLVQQASTTLANSGSLSYGTTGQGEPLTDTFTVKNVGIANLTLADPIGLPGGFTLAQDFGATTLAPGATTTFAVTLAASATGTPNGNLSFGTNDPNNTTYHLALSGTVVASPIVEVLDGTTVVANNTSTAVNFGTALVGTALMQTFKIENNGSVAMTLDPTKLTLPPGYSVSTPYASSVAAGSYTTLALEINGSTAGTFSRAVSFPTNDVDNATFSFPVTGTINTPASAIELFNGTTQILPFVAGTTPVPPASTINFGASPVGTPVDLTLTVKNVGTADLIVPSAIQLPSDYRLVSWNGQPFPAPTAMDVPVGGSATMTLELLADFAGTYAGAANLFPNDPANQTFSFELTGVVQAPAAQVTLAGANVAWQTGSVNFGDTTLSTPVVDTFTVTNGGTSNLSLTDPIVPPYGFSVVSDFGATTLAPGASTTFAVQLDASSPGTYQGTLAFETNDPGQALFYFPVSGQVATPVIKLNDGTTTLANGGGDDFGSTTVGTVVQRTLSVTNTGTGTLSLSDPINLPSGFTLLSDFGGAAAGAWPSQAPFQLAPGASTSFSVELTATTAGFYDGNLSFATNAQMVAGTVAAPLLTGAFQVALSGSVAAPRLDIAEGTTDVTSYAAGGTGTVSATNLDFGETVAGTPRSETFTVKNTGTNTLVLSDPIGLSPGFTLTQDFGATTLAPGASTTFIVALSAAAAGDISGSISFGTNLPASGTAGAIVPPGAAGATFSLPVQGEVLGLTNFRLWNDTGYSMTDGHTSDATVAGNLVGVPSGTTAPPSNITVQFQVNGDGTVDGSVQANSTGPFTFAPANLALGAVTVAARIHLVDAVLGDLYTSWLPLSFTLESGTDAAPVVTNLALQTVTVPTASTPTSSIANITGLVLHDGNVADMTVQVDTTGSGNADTSVTTDTNGNFVYQPQNLTPGTFTYHFRAIENAYPSGQINGPWEPFTFTVVTPNAPVVDKLSLANVTGPGTNTTTDPTLTGHVTADGNPQQVEVDFDYNGQGVANASVMANADGTFTFKPVGLALGSLTIHVRAVNVDKNIIGSWTTLSFTLAAPQAPTVNTFALVNMTGGAGTNVTDDPTLTGTLTGGVGVANVTVQFDTKGIGMPDGSTTSDANGNFTWLPTGLNPGSVTIAARAVATDPATGSELVGAWKKITFTYSTSAGPAVSTLSLAHPTGTDQPTGLSTAVDPTLVGTLTNGTALASFLTVQYELSGSKTPDGSTMTDAQGNFTLTPNGLPLGTVTIQVRGVTRDPQTGAEVDGAWKSSTFILQQNPLNQAPVTPANSNQVATGDAVAATSRQADVQAVNDGIQSFNTAMGAGSTASGQISVGVGTYAALADMTGGRVISGSIFAVQNGSIPAPAGVGSGGVPGGSPPGGPVGPSLAGSSPVGLPSGTPLNVSNLSTPQAASGTVSNQAISAGGTLGPGSAVVSGSLNGSWTITATADPNHSNVTDWTVTVGLSETFNNNLSGSYTDTAGTATLNHNYTDGVGGSYSFTFKATGTTTQTAGGTVIAGTFTLSEGNSYSYSFSDVPSASSTATGSTSTGNEIMTAAGSHSYQHLETGGSLSSAAGAASVTSTFVDNETETYKATNGTSGNASNGSADGSNSGGTAGNESFKYAANDFQTGSYTGGGGTWSKNDAFRQNVSETDTFTQTDTSNFSSSTADGQIDGGSQVTRTITDTLDNSESGNLSLSPNSYTLGGSFNDKQSQTETDQVNESGSMSENLDGVSSTGSFSYDETDNLSATDDQSGNDNANGTNLTVTGGKFDDTVKANDQIDYSDSGNYQGTITPPPSPAAPGEAGSPSPGPKTVSGSYSDSTNETDNATGGDNGNFSENNGAVTDSGTENDNATSTTNYKSSGSDNQSDATGSYSDTYSDSGTDGGTFTNNDSFSDSPTNDTANGTGTLNVTDTAQATASDSGTLTSPSSTITFNDNLTENSTDTVGVTDNYTDTSNPATSSFSNEDKGTGSGSDTSNQTVGWGVQGTITGSNAYTFNEGGTGNGTATSNANENFDDTSSSSQGQNNTDNGTFSDGDNSNATAFYNDTGTLTSPGMTINYTDKNNETDTANVADTNGKFSDGATSDRSANFNNTDNITDDGTGTANGTYNQNGTSGSFTAAASDHKTDDASDNGNYDNGATNTRTDNFTKDNTDHSKLIETDGGMFTGGATGTYSDGQTKDDTTITDDSGKTNTAATGTASDGNYDNEIHNIDGDYSTANEQIGGQSLGGTHTDYSKVDDVHDGTFDDSATGDVSSGSFNDGQRNLTTDTGSQSGPFDGGTFNQQGYDGTLSIDSAGGSENGTNGAVSDNGSGGDNTVKVDGGSNSHQYPVGGTGSHSDSASVADTDLSNANGPFTTSGGAIATQDVNYGDHDTVKSKQDYADSTSSSNGQGGTTTYTDSFDGTDKNKRDDSGERVQTSAATTDDGTDTDTDHGMGTYSNQTTTTFPGGSSSSGITNGDTSDGLTGDKYDVKGSGRTDHDTFDNENRPTGTLTNQSSYTAPGDPGTNNSSSETATTKADNVDDGTADQTNGSTTGETDNFTDTKKKSDDTSYNAASDKGAVSGPVSPGVPSLTYTRLIIGMGLSGLGQTLAAAGYGGPTTTTSTASLTTDGTENDLADGTTTNTAGKINTDEGFSDTTKSKESASVSYSTTSVNAAPGNDYTANYSATETGNGTDNNGGTIDLGVTKDNYSDVGTQTDTVNSSSSFDTSSSSGGVTNTAHGSRSFSGTDTQTPNESGDYTTEPPGTQALAPTPDNPNGYAVSDQTIGYGDVMTSTRTQTFSGSMSGPNSSVSGQGDYTAIEKLSINSNSTVNVNVAQNKDTQSGGYGSNASESQIANYSENGSWKSLPYMSEVWTFSNHQEHSGYNNDGGSYGGKDSDTQGSNSSGNQSDTETYTYYDPKTGAVGCVITVSHGGSGGGGGSNSTTGNAPEAEVDPAAGLYTQQTVPYTVTSKDVGPAAEGAWAAFGNSVRDNLDKTQTRLGVLGMIPGAGIVPDAINTVISLGRGNFKDAAFNGFAAIPLIGDAARGAKLAKGAGKTADVVGDIARGANKVENAGQGGKTAIIGRSAATEAAENVIIVTPKGVAITGATLAKQGTSALAGNFTGLAGKSVDEIIERVPKQWKMVPQDKGKGIKFIDEAGFERIRLHGPSANAPAGSNSASGWVLRVMDRAGNYYDSAGKLVPYKANSGHIPIKGNLALP